MEGRQRRRPPRRAGRAASDAERRRLAQASREERLPARSDRPVLWCDGGSRGNPGPSAYGFVLEAVDGSILAEEGMPLGVSTAAVAELRGVLAGLRRAAELGVGRLEVRTDSQVAVAQLSGEKRVRNPTLRTLVREIEETATTVGPVRYRWVRRERNARANALVAAALDI
ncbi:MAG: ribonuclease HI family protein [Gaiellaceae bacterium]